MQVELEHWITALRVGVGLVPPILIAILLLGGPTGAWLLYRFVVQPRAKRMSGMDASSMWVCANCRSVNELRMSRCYRCDSPADGDLEVISADPTGPIPLTPVGPGLDLGGGRMPGSRPISRIERAEDVWVEDEALQALQARQDRAALPDVAAMTEVAEATHGRRVARPPTPVPVGPGHPVGRPAVARPRRAVVAGPGRVPDPDDTPAA